MVNNKQISVLTDREHILSRPGMYFGGKNISSGKGMVLKDDKFQYTDIEYIPGLVKIIYEALDNAVDVAVKSKFEYANKIDVLVTAESVSVKDNGYGIPQTVDPKTGLSSVVLAIGHARSGSNFDNSVERLQLGMNGYGIFLTNVYSKKFVCDTFDGKNRTTVEYQNNAESYTVSTKKCVRAAGTTIEFYPDLNRFNTDKIDDIHVNIIKQRVLILAITYPEISFTFNGEKIKFRNHKQFAEMFGEDYEIVNFDNGFIAYYPTTTDEFTHFSILNGQVIKNGGNHIEYMNNKAINYLRDKFSRKYKDIKPSDIKNKLMVVSLFRNFPNPEYASQTKEELTNSAGEIGKYLKEIDFDTFSLKIYRNNTISELITEMYKIREEFKKQKELNSIGKKQVKIKSDKYWPPVGNKEYLFCTEGDSARAGMMVELGRAGKGFFALRGKMLNVLEAKTSKISGNEEIDTLIKILDTKISSNSLPVSGNFYIITDENNDTYTVHENDLILIDNEWKKIIELDESKYNKKKIDRSKIDVVKYFAQYKVNQPFDISYNYVVAATDQDLDGCFIGSTTVKLTNGESVSFEKMVESGMKEFWVYSQNDKGVIVPALATNPRVTKKVKKLIEIQFENGKIRCTPEHLIMLEDGEYLEAQDLCVGDYIRAMRQKSSLGFRYAEDYEIVGISEVNLEHEIPVYDLTVPKYHNFVIDSSYDKVEGIVVHNSHIRALILTFFNTFMVQVLKAGRMKYLQTPLIALKKGNAIVKYFFTFEEYNEFLASNPNVRGEWKYYKGLGSWAKGEFKSLIDKEGIEKFLKTYEYDKEAHDTLVNWMSKSTSDYRKIKIQEEYIDASVA